MEAAYRENLRLAEEIGDAAEILRRMREGTDSAQELTPEQALRVIDVISEGDPGGRGWHVRVPPGASWVAFRDEEDDPAPGGPEPAFGFGEPPVSEGAWQAPGY